MLKLKFFRDLSVSVILGFAIWGISPYLTGEVEPWDAYYPFYLYAFLIGGGALSLIFKVHFLVCGIGVWMGQILALLVLPGLDRSWIALGFVTTFLGSFVPVLGNVIVAFFRYVFRQSHD